MFWVGLFGGICVYAIFTLVLVLITKHKQKKKEQEKTANIIKR